jgi:hypothetical protein
VQTLPIKIISALAKKALKKIAKEFAKRKLREAIDDFGILKAVGIVVLSIIIAIPLFTFSIFGNLMCTVLDCEEDTGLKSDVVSIGMLKDISSRMEQLRIKVNEESDEPGENYGTYKVKLLENDSSNESTEINSRDEAINVLENSPTAAVADTDEVDQWVVGKKQGLNPGFLNRLAAIGKSHGKIVHITSGHRSIEEQRRLYEGYIRGLPGYNLAAKPGQSRHNYGLAADVSGWLQELPETALLPYGLHKPVLKNGENWHVEPIETRGKTAEQLSSVTVDGTGSTVSGNVGGDLSEAYIHLLALGQADELEITFLTKDDLDREEKKGTNLGKTWKLAKAIKKEIKTGTYKDEEIMKRAEKEKWSTRQYVKLSRWEIQKCFLLGDDSTKGLFEYIFGGPTPCRDIERLTGEKIVPTELQGVISKTTSREICIETQNGKCVKKDVVKTVKYKDVQELLYMYADISLFKNKDEFKPIMKEILDNLYERFASPATLSDGFLVTPTFISPLEAGTYEIDTRFGQSLPDGSISKGVFFKVDRITPVYSSISGKILSVYVDPPGSYNILIAHPSYGFVEYRGLSEVLIKKGMYVQQGQLIGSMKQLLEFRVCTEASVNLTKPTCINASDPESGESKISLVNGIDAKKSKQREKDYQKWKQEGGIILMPGFNAMATLGQLSKKYESSGDPGLCVHNKGDAGGMSCGTYQIANSVGTMDSFLSYLAKRYPQFYNKLASVPRVLSSFGPAWRSVYNSDPVGFAQAQHDFIGETHYMPVVEKIKNKYGFDVNTRSRAVMEMFWSYSVQHRNNTIKAFSAAIGNNWRNMSDEEIITRMYDYRINRWSCCTNRFVNEKKEALAMLNQEQQLYAAK